MVRLNNLQHLEFVNSSIVLTDFLATINGSVDWLHLPGVIDAGLLSMSSPMSDQLKRELVTHVGNVQLQSFRLAFTRPTEYPDLTPLSLVSILRLRPILRHVSHLDLSGCPVSDDVVNVICRTFDCLAVVLLYETEVTGVSVRSLANRYGKLQAPTTTAAGNRTGMVTSSETLQYLGLLNCHFCGHDAIEWAKRTYTFGIGWSKEYSATVVEELVRLGVWIPPGPSAGKLAVSR